MVVVVRVGNDVVVDDDVVDNVVVSGVVVWPVDELSVVWLDPFTVALDVSVVSLYVDVDGGTAVVVDIVDEDVVVVDSVVVVVVGTSEDVDSTVIIEDPVVFVVSFDVGGVEDNEEVDVELAWQTSTRKCTIRTHKSRRIVLQNHFLNSNIHGKIQFTPYSVEFFE